MGFRDSGVGGFEGSQLYVCLRDGWHELRKCH